MTKTFKAWALRRKEAGELFSLSYWPERPILSATESEADGYNTRTDFVYETVEVEVTIKVLS